jgi:tetrapyrrole methylase family protein/MazG family protein
MAHLHIVGLGSGDERQLPVGSWELLRTAGLVLIRTADHPVCQALEREGIQPRYYDDLYEQHDDFGEVYARIVDDLIGLARSAEGDIVYAVPGHPSVAEATVRMLKARCPQEGISFTIHGGDSFLDQAFARFGFDPIEGFMLLDASSLRASLIEPSVHTIIAQIYDAFTASDAKLALLDIYPPEHEIVVGKFLGVRGKEEIHRIPLVELDRLKDYGNHLLVWIPASDDDRLRRRKFDRLHEIVAILRSPEGCPWDREQTHQSIRKNLIEETYEVLETIDDGDPEAMCEELGDLLLQIMLHSQMEEEAGTFSVYDVIDGLNRKLIRRHPHVFGDRKAGSAGEALQNWEQIKAEEKRAKGADKQADTRSLLDGVPRDLPQIMRALEYQKRAAKVGFDWPEIDGVFDKIQEELRELKEAAEQGGQAGTRGHGDKRMEELGDLLFAVINAARMLHLDPDQALAAVNRKFYSRFAHIESRLREHGLTFADVDLDRMEEWWQEAKKQGQTKNIF